MIRMTGLKKLAGKWGELLRHRRLYRTLRRHLASMPVGLPPTATGVERRLLSAFFRPDEARLALSMTWRFEEAGAIAARAVRSGFTVPEVEGHLAGMERHGSVLAREREGKRQYALAPFVIGMYEMQVSRLTPGMYLDTREYFLSGYALEYLTTARPQFRVIPVEKSVTPEHGVATYDEIRSILEQAGGRIGVAPCICKKGRDQLGEPCRVTDAREVCFVLNDSYDQYSRHGWARGISLPEALSLLDLCEKDGLVLQPSNMREPEFICACCKCCCGIMEVFAAVPRPSDYVASNYRVQVDAGLCNGCGRCVKRCQMDALAVVDKKAVLEEVRCIGCGLCVTTCSRKALRLEKKIGRAHV